MTTLYDQALAALLADEGGRVQNSKDPGGRTNRGITQRTFDAWQDAHRLPRRDVWTITEAEAGAIYRNRYFDPVHFDALPAGVGYCVIDESANSGPHQAALDLQRALGVTADGAIGVLTLAAAAKADPAELIGKLCDVRLGFMRRCKAKDGSLLWRVFGNGWKNRVAKVRARALAMAAGTAAAPPAAAAPACTRPGCPLARAA